MRTIALWITGCLITLVGSAQQLPHYEFRGVWVATVDNIDWPSKKGLPVSEQKAEFMRLLDMHQRNGMNAIVMQIRPVTDAFYPSQYEPWSEFLTGTQGKPPSPYYDPLKFMIAETHKRGMEFHAWINPYRAVFNVTSSSIAPTHVTRLFPKWFLTYGGKKYFDPGLPEAQEHVNRVIKDIVERYAVDAIHFDDYFYPYRIPGKEFPDNESFAKYGNGMTRDDWRRSNVDTIIKMLYQTIRTTNPRVKFGISPFGVWRNRNKDANGSNTTAGQTNYDDLYADILLWLRKGWIDYVAPQLYWEIGHKLVDYHILLDWWSRYSYGKQLFIGQGIYRALESRTGAWKSTTELPNQIIALRNNENVQGSIYFSSKSFARNPNGWSDSLRNNYYALPALVPPMKWIDSIPPLKPIAEKLGGSKYRIMYRGSEPIKAFAIYTLSRYSIPAMQNATLVKIVVEDKLLELNINDLSVKSDDRLYVAAVDLNNNVSDWVEVK